MCRIMNKKNFTVKWYFVAWYIVSAFCVFFLMGDKLGLLGIYGQHVYLLLYSVIFRIFNKEQIEFWTLELYGVWLLWTFYMFVFSGWIGVLIFIYKLFLIIFDVILCEVIRKFILKPIKSKKS